MTTSLADIQSAFQNRLLTGADDLMPLLANGGRFFKVYDNAYSLRLLEVLAEDFSALHTLLGDQKFEQAMRAYLADHPSQHTSIRWLGRHPTEWLGRTEPWRDHRELADMAAFEWALGLAFDAPDAPVLESETLADVAASEWPSIIFSFHPAFRTVDLLWDIIPFQQIVTRDDTPTAAPMPLEHPATWAVWRDPDSLSVCYSQLDKGEAKALNAAREGATFADLCTLLAETADETVDENAAAHAAGMLKSWIDNCWITGLAIKDNDKP